MRKLYIVLLLVVLAYPVKSDDPEVTTSSGKIRGFSQQINGVTVNTFLGVPFAKPPIKDLRFKRPVPIEKSETTLVTKKYADACPQPVLTVFKGRPEEKGEDIWNPKTNMSEDCLYLNIWVPESRTVANPKTTMVWIYGGGFYSGTTAIEIYDGKYLASLDDVIVVSISYRLGALGFLYLGHDAAPGNMGLLDQNLGLRWIYENIESFGGDSNSITIFGESAGAASVNYQVISPLSNSYFQRAIMQSGSVLGQWAFQSQETAKKNAYWLAAELNCSKKSPEKIIKCLNLIETETIQNYLIFLPTIDSYFISKSPNLYLNEITFTTKDLLVGLNLNEYTYFLLYNIFNESRHPNYNLDREEFLGFIPEVVKNLLLTLKSETLLEAILHEYEHDIYPHNKTFIDILDDIGGDYDFKCPVIALAQNFNNLNTGTRSVYMYSFEHRSTSNVWPKWTGVLHGDEIEYVFGIPTLSSLGYTNKEHNLSRKMMKYWSNFAKTGNPNGDSVNTTLPNWPKYTKENEDYIVFTTKDTLSIKYGIRHKQCHFWNTFLPKLSTLTHCQEYSETTNKGNNFSEFSISVILFYALIVSRIL